MSKEKMLEVCTEIAKVFEKHKLTNLDVHRILKVFKLAHDETMKEEEEKLKELIKKDKGDK